MINFSIDFQSIPWFSGQSEKTVQSSYQDLTSHLENALKVLRKLSSRTEDLALRNAFFVSILTHLSNCDVAEVFTFKTVFRNTTGGGVS